MTSLTALFEAAKAVEYDEDPSSPGKPTPPKKSRLERERMINTNNRQTHNILEKNRRAELKNFFQRLKESVPKLHEKPKASNVSILTEAMKYIQELNKIDQENEAELVRLRRCRMCLEERVKMLKEEIHRQTLQKQLFAQVDEEKKRATSPPSQPKEMMSVEVQANEQDIRDAFPDTFPNDVKDRKRVNPHHLIQHSKEEKQEKITMSIINKAIEEDNKSQNNHKNSPGKGGRLKHCITDCIVKIPPPFQSSLKKPLQSSELSSQQNSDLDILNVLSLPRSKQQQHDNRFYDCEETDSENESELKIVDDEA